jgi:hypothetical protein
MPTFTMSDVVWEVLSFATALRCPNRIHTRRILKKVFGRDDNIVDALCEALDCPDFVIDWEKLQTTPEFVWSRFELQELEEEHFARVARVLLLNGLKYAFTNGCTESAFQTLLLVYSEWKHDPRCRFDPNHATDMPKNQSALEFSIFGHSDESVQLAAMNSNSKALNGCLSNSSWTFLSCVVDRCMRRQSSRLLKLILIPAIVKHDGSGLLLETPQFPLENRTNDNNYWVTAEQYLQKLIDSNDDTVDRNVVKEALKMIQETIYCVQTYQITSKRHVYESLTRTVPLIELQNLCLDYLMFSATKVPLSRTVFAKRKRADGEGNRNPKRLKL